MSPRPSPLRLRASPPATSRHPEQARFDKLRQQVEHAQRTLAAWQAQLPDFMSAHRERTLTRVQAVQAIHRRWLHALDFMLAEKGWTQRERDCLQDLLCETAWQMLERQATPEPALQALYDRHATRPYAEVQQAARPATHQASGKPPGHAEAQAEPPPAPPVDEAVANAPTPADPAAQSLREVFRKLASALHPDRETDPAKQAHRTELMKRVNQAHDQKDLLALLALQLEAAQVSTSTSTNGKDMAEVANLAPDRLKAYNQALLAQLAHVKAQLKQVEADFRADFMVPPAVNLHPQQLTKVLDLHLAQLHHTHQSLEADLDTFGDRAATKRWLKAWMARGL